MQKASDQQDGQRGCGGWLSQVKKYKHFLREITPELTKHAGYRYTKCKHAVLTSYIGHSYNYIHTSSKQPKPNMNKKDTLLTFHKSGCIVLKSASKSQHIKELKVALFHYLCCCTYVV